MPLLMMGIRFHFSVNVLDQTKVDAVNDVMDAVLDEADDDAVYNMAGPAMHPMQAIASIVTRQIGWMIRMGEDA